MVRKIWKSKDVGSSYEVRKGINHDPKSGQFTGQQNFRKPNAQPPNPTSTKKQRDEMMRALGVGRKADKSMETAAVCEAAECQDEIRKARRIAERLVEKAGLPEGTIRAWADGHNYKKVNGEWVRQPTEGGGKRAQTRKLNEAYTRAIQPKQAPASQPKQAPASQPESKPPPDRMGWEDIVSRTGKNHLAVAYAIHDVINNKMSLEDALDNQNLYGNRPDIVAEQQRTKNILQNLGYKV